MGLFKILLLFVLLNVVVGAAITPKVDIKNGTGEVRVKINKPGFLLCETNAPIANRKVQWANATKSPFVTLPKSEDLRYNFIFKVKGDQGKIICQVGIPDGEKVKWFNSSSVHLIVTDYKVQIKNSTEVRVKINKPESLLCETDAPIANRKVQWANATKSPSEPLPKGEDLRYSFTFNKKGDQGKIICQVGIADGKITKWFNSSFVHLVVTDGQQSLHPNWLMMPIIGLCWIALTKLS